MGSTYSFRREGASFLVLTMIAGAHQLVGGPTAQAQSLADRLKAVQSGQADRLTKLPAWKPVGSTTSTAMVPLVSGLTVVTAVSEPPLGDYESIKMITAVGQTAVQLHYSASQPKMELKGPLARRAANLGDSDPMKEFPDKIACLRTIDHADLVSAVAYSEVFCASPAEHFTGSTSIGASSDLLAKLKAGQAVEFHYANSNQWALYAQQGAQIEGGPVDERLPAAPGRHDRRRRPGAAERPARGAAGAPCVVRAG